jgi:hypothetical protein
MHCCVLQVGRMDGKVWASRTLMLPCPALTPEQRLLDVSLAETAAKEGMCVLYSAV